MPRKRPNSETFLGFGKFKIAFTFSPVGLIPSRFIEYPKKSISFLANSHFPKLIRNLNFLRRSITSRKCLTKNPVNEEWDIDRSRTLPVVPLWSPNVGIQSFSKIKLFISIISISALPEGFVPYGPWNLVVCRL